ncbi:MAG: LamG-like jellyroll fold domain-containing protein [Cyclobacteriaceae bacterium]
MKKFSAVCLVILAFTTFVSCGDDENSVSIPKVTTGEITDVTESSVHISAEISDNGNAKIIERGFVYSSVVSEPTLINEKVVSEDTENVFNSMLDELEPETTYHIRAYATNKRGTGYGESISFTTEKPGPTTNGLVAYYNFEDNTNDQFGNNDAVPGGGAMLTYSFVNELREKAVNFSVADANYAVIDNTFDFENKTICFWVKADVITDNIMVPFVSDNPNKQFGLVGMYVMRDAGQKVFLLNVGGNPVTFPATEGVWYHITMVGAAKSYKYYINGSLMAQGTFDTYLKSSNGVEDTIIGSSRIFNLFFSGSLDNLRIYSRALSAEEIAIIASY